MKNTLALIAELLGFIATFVIIGFWLMALALN